ncbi:deoxyribose-phosphate aldolase [Methylobacterium sp. Leaf118]|uniref:deoxyribose-phosphate aldolase n=1 Tax=Methylobacterium sp. Leaf118 TaxID=2876562 RepID=UPI001E3AF430|nr:deoxyribose-phosphate aldolase [Methylobacterium sp. Leaf118]
MTPPNSLPPLEAADVARRAVPLLDLTDLSETCTEAAVTALCARACAEGVAAVCVWPAFVASAVRALAGHPVRVATVVNFPAGGEDGEATLAQTRRALADGAQEIDLVLPYRALLRGEAGVARAMVETVRGACGGSILLKVILESGMLPDSAAVAAASRLALEAGADFLKTSTGKTLVSATPEAAETMLLAIRAAGTGRAAGLKVSGGLRRVEDAARYLALAERIMGPGWVGPHSMRIGASTLLDDLLRARDQAA